MLYIIKDFEFDSTNLILTKNGETIDIRHNEAKLLSLLLEQANKVLSKEDILSLVWKDKVVSEQAVFQNISHLRGLFGGDAIKTFPKRGYQWQLHTEITAQNIPSLKHPAQLASQVIDKHNTDVINSVSTNAKLNAPIKTKRKAYWRIVLLTSLLFIIIISIINFQDDILPQEADTRIKLAYIPFIHSPDTKSVILEDNNTFDFTLLSHLHTSTFAVSAELEYPLLAKSHPLIMIGELREHKQQFYLDFQIKGPFGDWQGQLSSASQDGLNTQLQQHLKQTFIYDLLNKPQTLELKQAQLSIAHQQHPTDLINLNKLISIYLEMEELEKAMVMANKLETMAITLAKPSQLGNALLYQSEVLTRKKLYDLSSYKLTAAITQFEQIADLKHQADAWYAKSWLDHQQSDYITVKATLLKSATLALAAKDIMRELDALFYLSVMAYKHQEEMDKYLYLQQAENKMTLYQLPHYQFARVPFHYAIFAKTSADKEPHYKQVLTFTKLIPEHWVAQISRKHLMKYYIVQNRLEEAQVLIDNLTTDTPKKSYLKALLAQANNDDDLLSSLAQQTFEQAQLAGDRNLSLDAALLLCSNNNIEKNTEANQETNQRISAQINYDFYSQYINEKATAYWRQDNKEELLALSL
ncbi:MAG: DNA-binding winged helix-turn-helix (wHTH) protein [Alteromonadaceae bacterium]|jgi:DNA-binding winged helix-turn-helix (wHTH) protein